MLHARGFLVKEQQTHSRLAIVFKSSPDINHRRRDRIAHGLIEVLDGCGLAAYTVTDAIITRFSRRFVMVMGGNYGGIKYKLL